MLYVGEAIAVKTGGWVEEGGGAWTVFMVNGMGWAKE